MRRPTGERRLIVTGSGATDAQRRRGADHRRDEESELPMPDDVIDEMGPVDYLVVEFPEGQTIFNGGMAQALADLAASGTVRVLDLMILRKDADGSIDAFEIEDFDELAPLRQIETDLAELLAAKDVAHLAEAMENGTTAGVVVWENLWAVPFASAARHAGGQLVATGRIPIQAIVAALEADETMTSTTKEPDMPLRPARVARRGVIGAPVARTAAAVGTAAVVATGVRRRQRRRVRRRV